MEKYFSYKKIITTKAPQLLLLLLLTVSSHTSTIAISQSRALMILPQNSLALKLTIRTPRAFNAHTIKRISKEIVFITLSAGVGGALLFEKMRNKDEEIQKLEPKPEEVCNQEVIDNHTNCYTQTDCLQIAGGALILGLLIGLISTTPGNIKK